MEHQDLLDRIHRLHFIGIGGSGMCPMAEILHKEGFSLTGSDIFESDTLQRIRAYGIPVYTEHKAENIKDAEAVVYTAAVKQDNPELAAAREKGIPTLERSVMLGIVCRRYADAVAVSGTHGKTTTTAMLTQILVQSGKDPTEQYYKVLSSVCLANHEKAGGKWRRRQHAKGRCGRQPACGYFWHEGHQ